MLGIEGGAGGGKGEAGGTSGVSGLDGGMPGCIGSGSAVGVIGCVAEAIGRDTGTKGGLEKSVGTKSGAAGLAG
jgi:hypothetical protein